MSRYCNNCNTTLQERSKFCRMCGTPVSLPATEFIPATEQIVHSSFSPSKMATAQTDPVLAAQMPHYLGENNRAAVDLLAPETHAIVGFFEQAGFTLRFGAFMLDLLAVMLIFFVSALLGSLLPRQTTLIQWAGLALVISYGIINFLILAGRTGQTLGKKLLGIRIIKADQRRVSMGQIVMRHLFGYPISMFIFALGFLWMLWDRQQQGWHDKLAGTLVVRKRLKW